MLNKLLNIINVFDSKMTRFMTLAQVNLNVIQNFRNIQNCSM